MPENRSVLLIIADDWSPLAKCYGNEVIQTPRIDAFAERSIIFDHAFCTSPTCAASRANILTGYHTHTHGQYGHCHGFHGFRTHDHITSIPQTFRAAGIATGLIGKKHVEPQHIYPFEYEPAVDSRDVRTMADCARQFLSQNQDRQFYLHVGLAYPHRAGGQGYGNERNYPGVNPVVYDPADVPVPGFLPDVPEVRDDLADYYQAVSRFDTGVGAILDVLAESGRAEDTLVIVMSDHGMPFPGAKASPFESGHHCPFIIHTPNLTQHGMHNAALINWTNIRPTVHDWCGVAMPDDLPERSLLPILEDPQPLGWDETVYSNCFHEVIDYIPYRVWRGRRYKYVRNLAPGVPAPLPTDLFRSKTWQAVLDQNLTQMGQRTTQHTRVRAPEELYDLENDPFETTNLIDAPKLQEIVADYRAKLTSFREKTNDPWLEVDAQEGRIPPMADSNATSKDAAL